MMFALPAILDQSTTKKLLYCPQNITGFYNIDYLISPEESTANYCPQNSNNFFEILQTQEGTWNPLMLSTTLWLDADDLTTIAHSGGEVSQWNDKSGNGYHLSQSTQANRPLTNQPSLPVFNFKNNISFNTTAKRLLNTAWNFTLTSQHVFIVFNQSAQGKLFTQSNSEVDTGTGMYLPVISTNSTTVGSYMGSTTLRASRTMVTTNQQVNLFESRHDGTTLFNSVNCGTEVSFTQSFSATVSRMGLNLSLNASSAVGNGGVFSVAEVIVFNNASLSASDREKIQGYLAWKWNLISLLPSGHPYKTSPPNI